MINITDIISQTISGLIINLPWFILIYIGFKVIAREIKIGISKVPIWIEQYFKLRENQMRLEWAKGIKK